MRVKFPVRLPASVLLALAPALALAACSGGAPGDDATQSAEAAVAEAGEADNLPEGLDNAAGLQTMAEALKTTGIAGVFKERGSYTLLAPDDEAPL